MVNTHNGTPFYKAIEKNMADLFTSLKTSMLRKWKKKGTEQRRWHKIQNINELLKSVCVLTFLEGQNKTINRNPTRKQFQRRGFSVSLHICVN